MRKEPNELKTNVKKFYILLNNHPNSVESTIVFIRFLRVFLRGDTTKEVLPTIEVMTVLKEQKPIVFQAMKRMAEKDDLLAFLTGLAMDTQEAENKLRSIYESKRVD